MAKTTDLRRRARAALLLGEPARPADPILWEHTQRVVRAALRISFLPELADQRIDRTALEVAALYHEAGWVIQWREGRVGRLDILSRPTSPLQRELAADWVEERLADLVPPRTLQTAATAIRQQGIRDTAMPEAQVLADADALDEIGPLGFWQTARRMTAAGQGIESAVEAWDRQREYKFWEARIRESIRLEPVRELARRRLEVMDPFMTALAVQHRGEDLDGLLSSEHEPAEDGDAGAPGRATRDLSTTPESRQSLT